ncbi:hypothetical protein EHW64_19595 [Erwinia psidii]|uniref:phage DNA ejection protein n=1 Tax=Erwinia psidii TaxID=69224 RepID=UPI00226B74B0|nr:phage DNA ejection protein [Erwinia psidii]MCX8958314.1 hypothetical protein [Erwinia psidii]MCX8963255.1 hypothetical protein [Erwinia psidii]
MAYQPIDYTSGNGFLQGLQGAGLYQQVQQQKAQAEQQQAEQQQLQQFRQDWQTAYSSGDPAALDALVAKYPQQMETVQKAIGFRDDNHRMALGNAARDLRVAAASGDPAAFARTAMKHKSTLQSVGSTPEQLYQQFQQDPKGTQQLIDTVGMSSLGVKDYYAEQGNRADRQIKRDQVADASARGWAGLRQSAQFHADDMELKKLNYQQKQLENQFKAADNDLKRQELQQRIDAKSREMEQAKVDKVDSYNTRLDTLNRTIETANKVLNSDGFTGYFGTNLNPLSSRWIPGTDAADTSALVDTLKSQGFMSGIQQMRGLGALSNAEGQKVMDAIGSLTASQSEKSAKAAIKTIIGTTELAKRRLQQKSGGLVKQYQKELNQTDDGGSFTDAESGYSSLWGD